MYTTVLFPFTTLFRSFTGVTRYYTPSDLYKAILQSRTVQEPVAERFHMGAVYHTKTKEKTLKAFHKHVRLSLAPRSEEHTSELQTPDHPVCRLPHEKT